MLADLDFSLRDLEPAPGLWETELSGLGLSSVRSRTSCLSQGKPAASLASRKGSWGRAVPTGPPNPEHLSTL